MQQSQVEEMIDLLCTLDNTRVLADNGIGMASGWEVERLEAILALAYHPRMPAKILERPIDRQVAKMPYSDIGEGDLVSQKWMRENMPFLFD